MPGTYVFYVRVESIFPCKTKLLHWKCRSRAPSISKPSFFPWVLKSGRLPTSRCHESHFHFQMPRVKRLMLLWKRPCLPSTYVLPLPRHKTVGCGCKQGNFGDLTRLTLDELKPTFTLGCPSYRRYLCKGIRDNYPSRKTCLWSVIPQDSPMLNGPKRWTLAEDAASSP